MSSAGLWLGLAWLTADGKVSTDCYTSSSNRTNKSSPQACLFIHPNLKGQVNLTDGKHDGTSGVTTKFIPLYYHDKFFVGVAAYGDYASKAGVERLGIYSAASVLTE
jgi:hypothetical protein